MAPRICIAVLFAHFPGACAEIVCPLNVWEHLLALSLLISPRDASRLDVTHVLHLEDIAGIEAYEAYVDLETRYSQYLGPHIPESPMMSQSEILLLSSELAKATNYMEWGSGGSTVFASTKDNIKRMRTVENDEAWVNELKTDVRIQNAIEHSKLNLVYANTGPVKPLGFPIRDDTKALWPGYSDFPIGEQFDLILVDGRYRVACFLKSVRDAPRPFRMMVHDYERERYHVVEEFATVATQSERLAVFEPAQKDSIDMDKLEAMIQQYQYIPR